MGAFTLVGVFFSLLSVISLFAVFYKPTSPFVGDLDEDTELDEDGWEYKLNKRLNKLMYTNGPQKGQIVL